MPTAKNNAAPLKRGGNAGVHAFSAELADEILDRVASGESVRAICLNNPRMPCHQAVRKWIAEDRAGFGGRYASAREAGWEAMADELFAIADDTSAIEAKPEISGALVAQQRLAVDTRKWFLSKVLPQRFGDKVEISGNPDAPLITRIELVPVAPRLPAGKVIEHEDE